MPVSGPGAASGGLSGSVGSQGFSGAPGGNGGFGGGFSGSQGGLVVKKKKRSILPAPLGGGPALAAPTAPTSSNTILTGPQGLPGQDDTLTTLLKVLLGA